MTALSVPEVLRQAEAIIGERGWCTGDFTDAEGRVCAEGAINVAAGGEPAFDGDASSLAALEALEYEVAAYAHVWNDMEGRTADEVRAALLRAADRAVTE